VTDLDSRYGRTRSSSKRTKIVAFSTAGAFVVVFAAWLVWAGVLGSPAQLEVRDVGHSIVDDTLVEVQYELNVAAGTDVSCAVQAMNSSFSVVGWKIIDVPPSSERSRILTETVRTSELAVTGLIYRCWLT
jgi:hypothetical protein